MDVASFKTIIEVQKKDLQKLRTEKAQDPDPKLGQQKVEWSSFMAQASKQSRKKKRKLNAAKNKKGREEKMEKEIESLLGNVKPTLRRFQDFLTEAKEMIPKAAKTKFAEKFT